jgi:hypothetical protein
MNKMKLKFTIKKTPDGVFGEATIPTKKISKTEAKLLKYLFEKQK